MWIEKSFEESKREIERRLNTEEGIRKEEQEGEKCEDKEEPVECKVPVKVRQAAGACQTRKPV